MVVTLSIFVKQKKVDPPSPLCVGLNSDEWLVRKKGKYFMNFDERKEVVVRYERC